MAKHPDNDFDFSTGKDDAVGFVIFGVIALMVIAGLCFAIAAVKPM